MTKRELDEQMVKVVLPVLDPRGTAKTAMREYREAWTQFALAVQELTDSIRTLLPEVQRVRYWVCSQEPEEHFFDYDDPRVGMVETNWRTSGKSRCPTCAGILEERTAKVFAR